MGKIIIPAKKENISQIENAHHERELLVQCINSNSIDNSAVNNFKDLWLSAL